MASFNFSLSLISCCFFFFTVTALNIGIQSNDPYALKHPEDILICSTVCESSSCAVPPFLRYGKYCGLLYSGCPGEEPCDELDRCCMNHDHCIHDKNNAYLNKECTQQLLDCVEQFESSQAPSFPNATCPAIQVVDVIKIVMQAALLFDDLFPGFGFTALPPYGSALPPYGLAPYP